MIYQKMRQFFGIASSGQASPQQQAASQPSLLSQGVNAAKAVTDTLGSIASGAGNVISDVAKTAANYGSKTLNAAVNAPSDLMSMFASLITNQPGQSNPTGLPTAPGTYYNQVGISRDGVPVPVGRLEIKPGGGATSSQPQYVPPAIPSGSGSLGLEPGVYEGLSAFVDGVTMPIGKIEVKPDSPAKPATTTYSKPIPASGTVRDVVASLPDGSKIPIAEITVKPPAAQPSKSILGSVGSTISNAGSAAVNAAKQVASGVTGLFSKLFGGGDPVQPSFAYPLASVNNVSALAGEALLQGDVRTSIMDAIKLLNPRLRYDGTDMNNMATILDTQIKSVTSAIQSRFDLPPQLLISALKMIVFYESSAKWPVARTQYSTDPAGPFQIIASNRERLRTMKGLPPWRDGDMQIETMYAIAYFQDLVNSIEVAFDFNVAPGELPRIISPSLISRLGGPVGVAQFDQLRRQIPHFPNPNLNKLLYLIIGHRTGFNPKYGWTPDVINEIARERIPALIVTHIMRAAGRAS